MQEKVAAVPASLLDIAGAGEFLGLTSWQIRGLIRNQELPVIEVGNKFYLRRSTLTKWAERAEALVRS